MHASGLTKLIEAAKRGSQADLTRLLERFQKMIVYHCSLHLDDRNQVEDVAQEVIEKVIADISHLEHPQAFTAWLQKIIITTCSCHNRQQKRYNCRELRLDAPGGQELFERLAERNPDFWSEIEKGQKDLEQDSLQEWLFNAIRSLPSAQRQCFILYYYGGIGYQEIAQILEVAPGTVSSNMHKARNNLQKLLNLSEN
ncbi:MAG: RNA polymerase sigma factor [Coriobacteriales bacterium]|jgi:RNA polymerase sigma-70 factor (ECF subfamily)|nr:RNA polymerase sigma factor [Coriobacteriales bacterium]